MVVVLVPAERASSVPAPVSMMNGRLESAIQPSVSASCAAHRVPLRQRSAARPSALK